jgi:hypothetical protein
MSVRETYNSIRGTDRAKLIRRLGEDYRLNYVNAYYYAQVCDVMIDTLMRMGCELTVKGVMEVRVKKKNKVVDKNRKYINKAIKGEVRLYYSKHIGEKEIE